MAVRHVFVAAALAIGLSGPVLAQPPADIVPNPLFDQFLNLCDATGVKGEQALAKARSLGYVRPPAKFIPADAAPGMREPQVLWKVFDGGFIALMTGTMSFDLLPGASAEVCAVASNPPRPADLAAVGGWTGSAPIAQAGRTSYLFRETASARRSLPITLPELQAARDAGEVRALTTGTDNDMSLIMLLRPKP